MNNRRVAVIDLGSNSFKLLVAQGPHLLAVAEAYEDVRLLEKQAGGAISPEKFKLGVRAVKRLHNLALEHRSEATAIVGTSVFRTATNARAFAEAILAETGLPLRVLSGEEEAESIAAGVVTDSLVSELLRAPAVFDLGGGSLEFIGDGGRFVCSWPLGAVRMMREFVRNPEGPVPPEILHKIRAHVRETVKTVLQERVYAETPVVFCGGVLAIAHRILAGKAEVSPGLFPRKIPLIRLEVLLEHLAMRTAAERVTLDGIPAGRADVFPAALAVVLEIADLCGADALIFSPRNLRYGMAAKLFNAC